MHDELEGCFKEHLSALLRQLIQQRVLLRATLNDKLALVRRHDLNRSALDLPIISDRDAKRLTAGDLLGRRGN